MNRLNDIQGIIFDYGGTIDTNGRHWAEVLWSQYAALRVPTDKESFRRAYVFGERTLAKYPFIRPGHDFRDVLSVKVRLQMEYLAERRELAADEGQVRRLAAEVADACHARTLETLAVTRPVVAALAASRRLVLVSNFYGNIGTILADFGLASCFSHVVESAVVGVRKPDPAIYRLGVEATGLPAERVLVVGDSFTKDILPAKAVGCRTVWLKGEGWGGEETDEAVPDAVITDLSRLPALL